jgi:hypothetical protein
MFFVKLEILGECDIKKFLKFLLVGCGEYVMGLRMSVIILLISPLGIFVYNVKKSISIVEFFTLKVKGSCKFWSGVLKITFASSYRGALYQFTVGCIGLLDLWSFISPRM